MHVKIIDNDADDIVMTEIVSFFLDNEFTDDEQREIYRALQQDGIYYLPVHCGYVTIEVI